MCCANWAILQGDAFMRNYILSQKGYSLVEVSIALLLLTISVYSLTQITDNFYAGYKYLQIKEEVETLKSDIKAILNQPDQCARQMAVFVNDDPDDPRNVTIGDNPTTIDQSTDTIGSHPRIIYTDATRTKKLLQVGEEYKLINSNVLIEDMYFDNLVRLNVLFVNQDIEMAKTTGRYSYMDENSRIEYQADLVIKVKPITINRPAIFITLPMTLQTTTDIGVIISCYNKSGRPTFSVGNWRSQTATPDGNVIDSLYNLPVSSTTVISTVPIVAVSSTCPASTSLVSAVPQCSVTNGYGNLQLSGQYVAAMTTDSSGTVTAKCREYSRTTSETVTVKAAVSLICRYKSVTN